MKVLVTGANGMLASAMRERWSERRPSDEVVPITRQDVDLRDAGPVLDVVAAIKPDLIVHAAAKVGGIAANLADPAGFLMDNLLIDTSVLSAATKVGVDQFLYFGSSCMYPRDFRQPLVEGDILAAPLEPSNEGYAISKIAAARYCQYASDQLGRTYRVVIPSNLYGPNDDYSLSAGHLVAATLAKAHAAKVSGAAKIDVWGDGTARREFTFVGDLAGWVVDNIETMHNWPQLLNVGFGTDHSVLDYYRTALDVVGYECELVTDPTKPAGMHQKLMDSSKAREVGWNPSTSVRQGMAIAYEKYLESLPEITASTSVR